jgi:hypothetical protein
MKRRVIIQMVYRELRTLRWSDKKDSETRLGAAYGFDDYNR